MSPSHLSRMCAHVYLQVYACLSGHKILMCSKKDQDAVVRRIEGDALQLVQCALNSFILDQVSYTVSSSTSLFHDYARK